MIISGVMGPDSKLENVAPLCTIETSGWTGSQSGEVLFTGDGTTTDFSGKVDLPPVNPLNSFTLHYTIGGTSYSVTADENGNLSDANMTGTINQDGTYEFHFNTPPDDTTDGTADYNYGIPPSNLKNALDPSNPNPSDWGWTSSTGSGTIGQIRIKPLTKGIYLVTQSLEFYTVSGSTKLNLGYSLMKYDGKWEFVKTLIGKVYFAAPGEIQVAESCYLKINETFEKGIFHPNADSAGEFKVRWWNIEVFFIGI